MTKHYLECESAICKDSIEPNFKKEAIWYAGESVCQKTPYVYEYLLRIFPINL